MKLSTLIDILNNVQNEDYDNRDEIEVKTYGEPIQVVEYVHSTTYIGDEVTTEPGIINLLIERP